jgi:hypothetical protein
VNGVATVTVADVEVAVANVALPLYIAVIVFVPTGKAVVLRVAVPDDNAAVPSTDVPFSKVTFPVAVLGLTVAVSVTDAVRKVEFVEVAKVAVLGERVAAQATANLFTSIDPSPATRL